MNDATRSIAANDLLERSITFIDSCKSMANSRTVPLLEFLEKIKGGTWKAEIDRIRAAASNKKAAKLKVDTLPVVKTSGEFCGLKDGDLVRHNGLLCIDIDSVAAGALPGLRTKLTLDPHVLSVFVSPGGFGLKVIVPVTANCGVTHKACWEAANRHFSPLMPAGAEIDPTTSNVGRNCFASYDPDQWMATEPRVPFQPTQPQEGCAIVTGHVLQSNEKEFLLPCTTDDDRRMPAKGELRLSRFVEAEVWVKWVRRSTYKPGNRNRVIVERAPILLNLVAPRVVAVLLLRWFDEAPENTFNDSRHAHWNETWAVIDGCLKSWPVKINLTEAERTVYKSLSDARRRDAFRICRSLSMAKKNSSKRIFHLSNDNLGQRLNCGSTPAGRQLEYLVRDEIIQIVLPGELWKPGKQPTATYYKWLL